MEDAAYARGASATGTAHEGSASADCDSGDASVLKTVPTIPQVDEDVLRNVLWTVLSGSLEEGGEAMLSELGAVSSAMPMTANLAETQHQVATFMQALSPHIIYGFNQITSYIQQYLPPHAQHPPSLPSASAGSDQQQQQLQLQQQETKDLLETISMTQRSIEKLTQLNDRTEAQVNTLYQLWETIPSDLSSSISELNDTLHQVKTDIAQGTRLLTELPTSTTTNYQIHHVHSSTEIVPASKERNTHQISSNALSSSHEHDLRSYFPPSATDVFKAANQDESMDADISAMCKYLTD